MKTKGLMTLGLVLPISFSLLLVWVSAGSPEDRPLESLYTSVGIQRISPPVKAPDFTLKNLEGSEVSLNDFEGKVVFLNFWATWCGPCRAEMPSMERLWQRFKEENFVILAVDLRESREEVVSFMEEHGLTFPVLLDSKGRIGSMFGARAIPTTYLIDFAGEVVGRAVGARNWDSEDAFQLIESLLSDIDST